MNLDMIRNLKGLYELGLSYNNLSIDVNVKEGDLRSFPSLRALNLAGCKLSEFPVFLRNQSMLLFLDLSSNQIQGKIPNWISRFDHLRSLNLSHNLLTGFEEPLQDCPPAFFVDLHSNKLHGQLPVFTCTFIYLDISSNKFNSVIPYNIGSYLSQTSFISLPNNNLYGSIPPSMCNGSYEVLVLSHNNFTGRIPQCLMDSDTLKVLNIQDNMLHGNIPDTFSKSCALWTLHLDGNQLSGPLPKSLVNCKALEVLDLGRNRINDVFPFFLMNISTLHVIILQENKLQGPIGCPTMISSPQMLQIIDLAFNNFSGKLPRKCFTTWKAMMLGEYQAASQLDLIQFHIIGYQMYQVSVKVTFKGLEMQLVKILTVFTSIDFTSNHFEGRIPEELMNFKSLYFLNLSYNSLLGQIPSTIGNLRQLESLDLSNNFLDGEIPPQLANLNFLSFLNLSFNNLEGTIPTGTQIQSFGETSFEGNHELCGPPCTKNCSNSRVQVKSNSTTLSSFTWNFMSSELRFIFGIGMIVFPLLFCKRWRLWYWKFVDEILYHIFPQLDFVHERRGGKSYRTIRWKPR